MSISLADFAGLADFAERETSILSMFLACGGDGSDVLLNRYTGLKLVSWVRIPSPPPVPILLGFLARPVSNRTAGTPAVLAGDFCVR